MVSLSPCVSRSTVHVTGRAHKPVQLWASVTVHEVPHSDAQYAEHTTPGEPGADAPEAEQSYESYRDSTGRLRRRPRKQPSGYIHGGYRHGMKGGARNNKSTRGHNRKQDSGCQDQSHKKCTGRSKNKYPHCKKFWHRQARPNIPFKKCD